MSGRHRRPRAPPPSRAACRGRAPRARAASPRRPSSSCAATASRASQASGADGRRAHPEAHGRDVRGSPPWTRRASTGSGSASRRTTSTRGRPRVSRSGSRWRRTGSSPSTSRRRPTGSTGSASCRCSIRRGSSSTSTTPCSGAGSPGSRSRRSPATSSSPTSASSRSGRAPRSSAAIVFLHPFGCSLDERLDRFYLSNTVGQPAENAVALSHLIFAGVLDRHPDLKIVAAHGGGYLPTAIGRSDRAWQVRPEARRCEHGRRPTCAGCGSTPSCTTRAHAARPRRGRGRIAVVLGSDFPFDMGLDDPVAFVRDAGLDADGDRARSSPATPRRSWRPGCGHEDRPLGAPDRSVAERAAARDGAAQAPGIGEGFVIDDRVVPFPDGLTVADVLARGWMPRTP